MLTKPGERSISEKELLHTDDSDLTTKNDTISENKQEQASATWKGEAIHPAVLF